MEGALQSVKASLTALASQLSSLIKDQIDSTTAKINQVMQSVTEALLSWERISQKIEEELSKISSDLQLGTEKNVEKRSDSLQTSQSVEVTLPCRHENNDEEEESEDDDDLKSAMGSPNRIQVDEHEFPDSKFQDMAKDEVD